MNRLTFTCLLAAATLAACGQPPSPGTPQPVPTTEVTTTSTTVATTTSVAPPATTTTTQPAPQPQPVRTTTTAKPPPPPPPPPKPPDRWVLPAGLRTSIEQQTGIPFPLAWSTISGQLTAACPGKVLCAGYTLVVDASTGTEGDCTVVPKGIKVPDPLHEGGKITFRVTSTLCAEG
jgi:hypothetical protein